MEETILHIHFDNRTNPKSYFEVVRIEELLARNLNHDISNNHIVNFYLILFILDGDGYHTIDFTDYKYKKGTVLLVRKDQIQKFFRSTNAKGYLLIFTEDFIVSHLNKLEASKSFQLFNELLSFPKIELDPKGDTFSDFATLTRQIEAEYDLKDEYSIGITRSALHMVITKLFRIKSNDGQLSSKKKYLEEFLTFQELVEQNCFQHKKVAHYASQMAISTKTLNNIVQTVVNKPAKKFIDEVAIMQIKRLLISTSHPIKEIAFDAGFDDPANFFKYFKKYVGSSPEVFRNAHQ
ncbi:MAG: helix-turn-helix domain-containing protein [Bacteroidota bacterium]